MKGVQEELQQLVSGLTKVQSLDSVMRDLYWSCFTVTEIRVKDALLDLKTTDNQQITKIIILQNVMETSKNYILVHTAISKQIFNYLPDFKPYFLSTFPGSRVSVSRAFSPSSEKCKLSFWDGLKCYNENINTRYKILRSRLAHKCFKVVESQANIRTVAHVDIIDVGCGLGQALSVVADTLEDLKKKKSFMLVTKG